LKSVFRYRAERTFAKPPAEIWSFVADTARMNELVGMPPYRVEERADENGRVRRFARGTLGTPTEMQWEESYGEWQENHFASQFRDIRKGMMGRFSARLELHPEGAGSRFVFLNEIEMRGAMGLMAIWFGIPKRECDKRVAALAKLVEEAEIPDRVPGAGRHEAATPAARRRFEALIAELERDSASHGLAPKLADYLLQAPATALQRIRPLALARFWRAPPADVVEACLAAQRVGLLALEWDLLCPRCRGAKSRVANLHDLPEGAHCSSCNIDYQRDFTINVELTFHPEPWLRLLPEGEFCLLGPATTPHVRLQAEVAARSSKSFAITLSPGPYRFRTIEAGPEADTEVAAGATMPKVVAEGERIALAPSDDKDHLVVVNATDRPLFFVVEDRTWVEDALTGERVIAMPAFRRCCPEQLLRPGDNVEIARVAIMFIDLQGSTTLYDELGDTTAFHLVRDLFAFLSEQVERHNGFIVKTVGDAVMAAFHDPADAVRAALAVQDEVATFNRGRADAQTVLKVSLHQGPCIAITLGGTLDYFGSTVNTAARLETQCRGGELVVSKVILADAEAREVLAGRRIGADQAILRGLREPVHFVRIGSLDPT
jgi:class 3 adenylate cyclase